MLCFVGTINDKPRNSGTSDIPPMLSEFINGESLIPGSLAVAPRSKKDHEKRVKKMAKDIKKWGGRVGNRPE